MLKKNLKDEFKLARSLIARSSFRTVIKSAVVSSGNGGGKSLQLPRIAIPRLYLQTLLFCVYLELLLSILHSWEPRTLIPHLIQLRI